ncbi:unnamed protein product [Cochlearia groenlandica]
MERHYFIQEKGKWTAENNKSTCRPPLDIPESDNVELIKENKLSLIGRITNPTIQRTKVIAELLPQFWELKRPVIGMLPVHV